MKIQMKPLLACTMASIMLFATGCNSAANNISQSTAPATESSAADTSQGAVADPVVEAEFKLVGAHVTTDQHSFHLGMEAFKKEVEERSGGRISVEIHANGELGGNEDELVQKMATGTVDLIIAAPSFMTQSVREWRPRWVSWP